MSALFDRLSERHATGHAIDPARINLHEDGRAAGDYRPAAVLMAVTDRPEPGVLLIHRPSNMRAHPGQIALPGGKLDPGETAVEAALREAWEELGINAAEVRVIGVSDLYRAGSGFDITPVIGLVPSDMKLIPNPMEVAQWFEAPLDFLLDPANHTRQSVDFDGVARQIWEIVWQDHRILGRDSRDYRKSVAQAALA